MIEPDTVHQSRVDGAPQKMSAESTERRNFCRQAVGAVCRNYENPLVITAECNTITYMRPADSSDDVFQGADLPELLLSVCVPETQAPLEAATSSNSTGSLSKYSMYVIP